MDALREHELSQLVDMVPGHLWRLSPEGEPTYFNRRMADFLGFDVADADKPGMSRLEAMIETVVHADDRSAFAAAIRASLATGSAFAKRYRLRRADGAYRWMSSRAEPMRGQDGEIVWWHGLCHDIDDQVQAEEVLRRSERQLREMSDAVPARIWSTGSMGGPAYFNRRLKDYLRSVIPGFESVEAPQIEHLISELLHPEDAAQVRQTLQGCFETGAGATMRFRWRKAGGGFVWTECRVEPWSNPDGTATQWYGVSIDIDDQVRAEKALRRREQRLRQFKDAVPVQIWSVTARGEPAYMNKAMLDYMGVRLEDYDVSATMTDVVRTFHPADQAAMLAGMSHSVRTGEPFEMKYRCRRWDGEYRWMQGRAVPLRDGNGRISRWYGVNLDIHDMLTTQEELREREEELSLLVDMVPVLIGRLDANGEPTFFSKRAAEAVGLVNIDDLDRPGMSRHAAMIAAKIHPEDAPAMTDIVRHALATGEPYTVKFRRLTLDGSYRWMQGRAQPFRDASGTIRQWYTVTTDIDDEVRVQETLRSREKELSLIIEMVPVHIGRMAPDGEPTFFRKRTLDSLGVHGVSDMDNPGVSRLNAISGATIHPDDLPRFKEVLSRALATGEPYTHRYRRLHADGSYRWMEGRAQPLRDESGNIVNWYAAALDVDDEVRAQDVLREREREREQERVKLEQLQADFARAARVSMLGELTASIAHEVNQPLVAISASGQACLNWLERPTLHVARLKKLMVDVVADAHRAAEIISRIRGMAAGRPPERDLLYVDEVIREALLFIGHEAASRGVAISHLAAAAPQKVHGDRTQLQQVLVNLVINAMQAIVQAGSAERTVTIRTSLRDGSACCSIEDSGPGISADDVSRLFDSFFTTKENGMGMGLCICRSVIEAHGGRIAADNRSSHGGARFHFTLPVAS